MRVNKKPPLPKKDWRRHKGGRKPDSKPAMSSASQIPAPAPPLEQYGNFIKALKKGEYRPPPPPGPPMRYFSGGATRFGRGGKCGNVWMNRFEACKAGVQAGPARFTRSNGFPLVDLTNQDDISPLPPEDVQRALEWEQKMMNNSVIIKQEPADDYEVPPSDPPLAVVTPKQIPMEVSGTGLPDALKFAQPDQMLLNARADYEGRYYYSTLMFIDLEIPGNVNNWVLTTSTLAQLNNCDRPAGKPVVISVEVPGATTRQLIKPILTELSAVRGKEIKMLICTGLNDVDQGRPLHQICSDALLLKSRIKDLVPAAQISFIPLPMPPKMAGLPDNPWQPRASRTTDILVYNKFLISEASDNKAPSLQDKGIEPIWKQGSHTTHSVMYSDHEGRRKICLLGRRHIAEQWREYHWESKMHLHNTIRDAFWASEVIPFFTT